MMAGENQVQGMQETTLHPLAIVALVVAALTIFFASNRYAVLAFLCVACCISGAQNLNVFGTSWYMLRILTLCGIIRCICRSEWRTVRWSTMDSLVAAWAVAAAVVYCVQRGDTAAIIFKIGTTIDCAGVYFVFRWLLQGPEAITQAIRSLAWIAIPISVLFAYEQITHYNLFSIFGGVSSVTVMRDGKLRCQGAFAHPILAGVFWASNIPLFAGLIIAGKDKLLGIAACFASLVIILACSSSTPILGVMCAGLGFSVYAARHQMSAIRYCVCGVLFLTHMVMKAPVWHLVARVDIIGGSTGHYRFMLIDAAINHFSEWCLVGSASTSHWGKDYNHYLTDITNHYILEGLRGGAITMFLFVAVIWCAYALVGLRLRSRARDQWLVWCFGVALFVHCASFIAVSYFGQTLLLYYLHLAIIPSYVLSRPKLQMRYVSNTVSVPVGLRGSMTPSFN
jgi:hypothetical protein